MKIFPIKVERATPLEYKLIEWKLHNVCNHNCSFCGASHKDGSVRWLDLEKYKSYVDKLVKMCDGHPFWFQLTGGEPTLYPDLLELISYIKSKGAMISMISNGTRTLRWWKELQETNTLDYLFLTYHSEQTNDWQHISDVANLFHDKPAEVVILITHTIDSLDQAVIGMNNLIDTTGAIINLKAMFIHEYDIYEKYTKEQLTALKRVNWELGKKRDTKTKFPHADKFRLNHQLKVTYNVPGMVIKIDSQTLMKNKKNDFRGWDCFIGKDTIRIDSETVYRGICGEGEVRSLLDPNLSFTSDSIVCGIKECHCGSDMISTKILPKSTYPMA